jgi:hypothetical protein
MKKRLLALLFMCLSFSFKSNAQVPKDFYIGKWQILVMGSPVGDLRFVTTLVRNSEGMLSGQLENADDDTQPKRQITKVEEAVNKLMIYFVSSQGGEIAIELNKIDSDNLKGTLMTYETTATRLKN